jgi:phage-related protein
MKDLTQNTSAHKNQLETEDPFIWLFEFELPDNTRIRVTNFTERVEFGEDDTGSPLVYYPASIVHSGIEQSGEGDIPSISVGIATGGAFWLTSAFDTHDGLIGQRARIIVVSSRELDNPVAAIAEDARVISAAMDNSNVTLELSAFNIFQARLPRFLYSRRRCRWVFGSGECGYNVQADGAGFSACGYTLDDCVIRGDDEEANVNVSVRHHPERFGGFPGIPRGSRR